MEGGGPDPPLAGRAKPSRSVSLAADRSDGWWGTVRIAPLSSEVRRFSYFCGPRAIAAVTSLDPDTAAGLLLRIQREQGEQGFRDGHSSVTTMARALLELGHGVESWRPTRPPTLIGRDTLESLDDFDRRFRALDVAKSDAMKAAALDDMQAHPPGLRWLDLDFEGTWLAYSLNHVAPHRDGVTLNVIDPEQSLQRLHRITYPNHRTED